MSSKHFFALAFAAGLACVAWVGLGFVGSSWLAFAMTAAIAAAYLLGAWELRQFRRTTAGLAQAVADVPQPLASLGDWLVKVPQSLRDAVRLRVEGERGALPGPALTPYLVGLLVMLGMLGTFLGMVVTFRGAVFALEGSADLDAVRSALAGPIKGLALAFGSSVAGVAASAMLGLMSAISRRERIEVARRLDARIAGELQPFSLAHQRQETFRSLQQQARVLPEVAVQLAALVERIDQRSEQLDARLLERHGALQQELTQAYTQLADRVGTALHDNLAAGARAAGESIQPVVASTMAQLVEQTRRTQEHLGEVAQAQVDALSREFGATARTTAEGWTTALSEHRRGNDAAAAGLQQALAAFTDTFAQRSATLVADVQGTLAKSQAAQSDAETQRLQAWSGSVQALASELQAQWRSTGDAAVAQQRAAALALEQAAAQVAACAEATQRTQAQLGDVARSQVDALSQQFDATARTTAESWTAALAEQRRGQAEAAAGLQQALASFTDTFAQRSEALVAEVQGTLAQAHAAQSDEHTQRLQAWSGSLQALATGLQAQWRSAGDEAVAQQRAAALALEQAAARIAERAGEQASRSLDQSAQLIAQAQDFVRARDEAERQGFEQHRDRMEQLAGVWRTELQALRQDEGARGEAAVARLGQLEAAVASHLATLGAALEAPITRLLQTAAEVPQAAAAVVAQLREQMGHVAERDNLALQERTQLLERLGALLQSLEQAAGEQRAAIDAMAASAASVLEQAGAGWMQALDAHAGKASEMAAHLSGSAVELASLADAFGQGVQAFQASNDKLGDTLQGIDASLAKSTARSDEQLAYYVAQAREVIDLSIASQQSLFDNLRQLQAKAAAPADGAPA